MRRLSIYVALLASTAAVAACTNFEQEAVPDTFTPDTTTSDADETNEDVEEARASRMGLPPRRVCSASRRAPTLPPRPVRKLTWLFRLALNTARRR